MMLIFLSRDFISPQVKPVNHRPTFIDIPMYNELIKTLKLVAQNGSDAFYRGSVGQDLVRSLNGWITMKDLDSYEVVERDPIVTTVGNFQVTSPVTIP